jgi:hypothetical protein
MVTRWTSVYSAPDASSPHILLQSCAIAKGLQVVSAA